MHDLRILTLNCWNGRANPEAIARFLEERSVDLACFQELDDRQAGAIQEVLPHGKLEPERSHSGMGIAARYEAEVQHLPLLRRDARVTELDPAAWPFLPAPLQVVNVHVQAPHIRPWSSFPLRRAQVGELSSWLAAHRPAHRVLVGDLNSTPLWPAYRKLTRHLDDGVAAWACETGRRAPRTWGPLAAGPRLLRIDHVLTDGVRLRDYECAHVFASDHAGVLVDLDLTLEPEGLGHEPPQRGTR